MRNDILANTDNVTSIYLFLQNSFLFSPEEQRELIAHAAPSFKKNPAVKKVSHMLDRLKNVEPGMPYIDLPVQTIEGKETSLSTYIDKGKYILLDFWASWCPPCRRQTPYLKQLGRCIRCGACAKKCPMGAIEMRDNRPIWIKEQCLQCLGCLHRCPVFAIQYGKKTIKHGQFVHPGVKM